MTTAADIPLSELPDWMRQARRGIDWGMVLAFVFSLTIGIPFLIQQDLPHTNASENYVYRTMDTAQSIREGRLYPRWSPNALGGYGAPIPHYLPPAATYITGVIQILFTADPVLSVRITYVIALSVAGTLVYLLTSRRAGGRAGILAALLYVYSPYIGLTAPHLMGDLPGVITFALMPLFLWGLDRLITRNSPSDGLVVSFATAALIITNQHGVIVSTLLGIMFISSQWWTTKRIPWLRVITAYGIGLGISGFYWIPAFLEQDAIHWRPGIIQPNFRLTLSELLTPLRQTDPSELVPTPQFTLGIPLIGFSLVGIVSAFYFWRKSGFQNLFLIMGGLLILAALIFFPSDTELLGAICLCLAVGGSSALKWADTIPMQLRRVFLPTLLILIWILAMPVWLPPYVTDSFGQADARIQMQYELQGYGVAVMPPEEAIPSTIPDTLAPDRSLVDSYQSGNVNKIPPAQLTTNGRIGTLEHNTHSDRFQVRTTAPILLDVLTAYFPGWRASISGQQVPLFRNPTTGLIQIDMPVVPADELLITLGTTSVRLGAWIIAGASAIVCGLITWYRFRRYHTAFYEEGTILTQAEFRLLGVVCICFSLVIVSFNRPDFPFSLRPQPGYALENNRDIQSRTDAGISLTAFRLASNTYNAGSSVPLTLYWQAQRALTENYQAEIYLTNNRDGSQWDSTGLHHPGNYPTRRWKTGLYVTDAYNLTLSPDMPPGNYQINVELHTCNPDCRSVGQATFFNTDGQIIGQILTLPTLITIGG